MKQLLLYFLYFVVSSLIFLQCAKMFPSPVKINGHKSPTGKTQSSADNTLKKETSNIAPYGVNSFKSMNTEPVLDNSSMPYRTMMRISEPDEIYNPYLNFKNYKLALNEKWQRN
ncbi:MAG: hypothetical protein M3O71_01745 [Bacteroidota bacterium]|nr:hypothetical protein [Bacteroidota bacterium]